MHRLWNEVILPLIENYDAKHIVEIGSDYGYNTKKILEYCKHNNALLSIIDPFPKYNEEDLIREFGDSVQFYKDLSLSTLPRLAGYDVVLIDGDHNWYTVLNELKIIDQYSETFPLVILHDVGWPYGRRDLYYNPDNIPPAYRQAYKKAGILPEQGQLSDDTGLNPHLCNAIYENNPQNGVLTALDDFMSKTNRILQYEIIYGFHGLAIVSTKDFFELEKKRISKFQIDVAQRLEQERINVILNQKQSKESQQKVESENAYLKETSDKLCERINQKTLEIQRLNEELQKSKERAREQYESLEKVVESLIQENRAQVKRLELRLQKKDIELSENRMELKKTCDAISVHLSSVRYQIGDAFVKALKPSKHTLLLPFRIVQLISRGIGQQRKRQGHEVPNFNSRHEEYEGTKTPMIPPVRSVQGVNGGAFVDIVVCVHNALEDTKECLSSLYLKQTMPFNLIIVDDGSDLDTQKFLEDFAQRVKAKLIRHESSKGYTIAANAGLRQTIGKYVILLNSDTIVTQRWIEKLVHCAESDPSTGIVGPLSNAASWQTIPEVSEGGDWKVNQLPEGINLELMALMVDMSSKRIYPKVPFVNGFCFMIKRDVIDKVGLLDEETFPKGYGEENDYCIRAREAQFSLRIADDCYIFHEKSKSFTHEKRRALSKSASGRLKAKYSPEVLEDYVQEIKNHEELPQIRENISNFLKEHRPLTEVMSKKILFLLPVKGGSGGAHSVIQETLGLRECGLQVFIASKGKYKQTFLDNYPESDSFCLFYDETQDLIKVAKNFDIVIATIFTSVKDLDEIRKQYPSIVPAYYIQDYEPLFFEDGNPLKVEAEQSYNRIPGIHAFAKTHWLKQTIEQLHNIRIHKVDPSLDLRLYNPFLPRQDRQDTVTITAMIRPQTPRRGAAPTLTLLKMVKDKYQSQVRIQIFGCSDKDIADIGGSLPVDFTNNGVLKRWEVAQLLRSSDIFLDMSTYQAFGRTGLEAMASGCAVVLPIRGGTSEYAIDKVNSMLVNTDSIDECFEAICELIDDSGLLEAIKKKGIETAKNYSISKAVWSEIKMFQKVIN